MAHLDIGDKVVINKPVQGLEKGEVYEVWYIERGLDGAYDWDDIFIKGKHGKFCEFDFEIANTSKAGSE